MKKILIILLCSSITCFVAFAGNQRLPLKSAVNIVRKVYNNSLRQQAIADIHLYAFEGNDTAMFALGMVYAQGLGIKKDLVRSKHWYEKASEAGYLPADYILAMMYRRGVGIEQNFEKAYEYLLRAAQSNHPQTLYGVGYFLYKGLGCQQDYEKASRLFQEAAEKNYGYAMYMLGLCYRNGYGVERDLSKADYWLTKSAAMNVLPSHDELRASGPENPIESLLLKPLYVKGQGSDFSTYRPVKHEVHHTNNIQGVYSGKLISYDWSGRHVVKESKLDVTIEQYGNDIRALWKEEDLPEVEIRGLLTDTALVFKQAIYFKPSHPNRNNAIAWNFLKSELQALQQDSIMYLTGNLKQYSPEIKEPGRPMYLTLRSTPQLDAKVSLMVESVSVYPNPVRESVNVSFSLLTEKHCRLSVYSEAGLLLYEQALGKLKTGDHHYQLPLHVPVGKYILNLVAGDHCTSTIIIKE